MNITIENFKNLKQLNYTIDDNKINFIINNTKTQCFSQLKRMVRAGNDDPFDIALSSKYWKWR